MNTADEIRPQRLMAIQHQDWGEDKIAELAALLGAIVAFSNEAKPLVESLVREADSPGNTDKVQARLMDLGEELRHLTGHIDTCQFYDYLKGSNG